MNRLNTLPNDIYEELLLYINPDDLLKIKNEHFIYKHSTLNGRHHEVILSCPVTSLPEDNPRLQGLSSAERQPLEKIQSFPIERTLMEYDTFLDIYSSIRHKHQEADFGRRYNELWHNHIRKNYRHKPHRGMMIAGFLESYTLFRYFIDLINDTEYETPEAKQKVLVDSLLNVFYGMGHRKFEETLVTTRLPTTCRGESCVLENTNFAIFVNNFFNDHFETTIINKEKCIHNFIRGLAESHQCNEALTLIYAHGSKNIIHYIYPYIIGLIHGSHFEELQILFDNNTFLIGSALIHSLGPNFIKAACQARDPRILEFFIVRYPVNWISRMVIDGLLEAKRFQLLDEISRKYRFRVTYGDLLTAVKNNKRFAVRYLLDRLPSCHHHFDTLLRAAYEKQYFVILDDLLLHISSRGCRPPTIPEFISGEYVPNDLILMSIRDSNFDVFLQIWYNFANEIENHPSIMSESFDSGLPPRPNSNLPYRREGLNSEIYRTILYYGRLHFLPHVEQKLGRPTSLLDLLEPMLVNRRVTGFGFVPLDAHLVHCLLEYQNYQNPTSLDALHDLLNRYQSSHLLMWTQFS